MPRNPAYPSNLSLREDECVDELLFEQQTAVDAFRSLVAAAHRRHTARLEFLPAIRRCRRLRRGFRCRIWMNDLLAEHPPEYFTDRAIDLARHVNEPDPDRAYDERRDRMMDARYGQ